MGDTTKIAWTDATFNAWWGCTKVSEECDFCYAEVFDKRIGGHHWGAGAPRRLFGDKHWREPEKWNTQAAKLQKRRRVFCNSMADVFDSEASPSERERLWDLIRATPWLDWQLLTKRPHNIRKMLPGDWGDGYANVWLGTTAGNRKSAAIRIPPLREVPARVRFISGEPLLEDLGVLPLDGIDWLIVGGESGHHARPMKLEWAQSLQRQCEAAGVAFFFKQTGSAITGKATDHGYDPSRWPADLRVQQFPEVRNV